MTYEPERIEADGRRSRSSVDLNCEVRQGMRPWSSVTLHDISDTGFRMDWRPGLDEGAPLYIRIPGLTTLTAHLRWKREAWIGCEFDKPLYPAVYENIVQQAQLQP